MRDNGVVKNLQFCRQSHGVIVYRTWAINLVRELPAYLAAADGVVLTNENNKLACWVANNEVLYYWASLVKKLFCCSRALHLLRTRTFSLLLQSI